MTPEKRKPRAGGNGRGFLKINSVNSNNPKHSPQAPKDQALLRRRGNFARAMTFSEFRYRDARALDYDGFVDRRPNQAVTWRVSRDGQAAAQAKA